MSTLDESPTRDRLDEAAAHEWLSWTRMADFREEAPPILVGGEGPYVIDADGRRLFDGVSGLFTTQIGYSHGAELGAAASRQLESIGFYPNWAPPTRAPAALSERVTALAPERLSRVFFTSGGSEAVESALKLIRLHWLGRGEPLRRKLIGRLGAWFGSAPLEFDPDVITFAKGITSGQAPLGGMLFSDEVAAPLLDGGALYAHGFTFGGHPLSCAVALANLDIMERVGVLENVRALEGRLTSLLDEVAAGSPLVVEARGRGFFRALELRDSAVLPAARDAIRRAGVIVRLDDRVNPCLAISPPLISRAEQLAEMAAGIAAGLAEANG